jgi:leucyl-tRNA synthetase
MFLYDLGLAKNEEPFRKLFHQGMIRFNGEKMSKSRGNTISPDDYDPDVLRMYLMFIGPYWAGGDWSDQNIMGVSRFLDRFRAWMKQAQEGGVELNYDEFQRVIFSNTQAFKFNKVVSEFMTLIKTHKNDKISIGVRDKLVDLLNIYAPGFKV